MRTPLTALMVVLGTTQALAQVSAKQMKDSLVWGPSVALTMDDYRAKPKPNATVLSSIVMRMHVRDEGGTLAFVVEALFLRAASFMKGGSEYNLKHEQVIFDLCESHARKLRKRIAEKDFGKSKDVRGELTAMFNKASGEYLKDREKYEKETEFGLNAVKQGLWAERVAKELVELGAHASPSVPIGTK